MAKPMLASSYTPETNLPPVVAVQPKLDGVRAIITKEGIFSRNGKKFTSSNHIHEEAKSFLRDGEVLDGELFNHSMTFEQISGAVRKNKPCQDLQFHIFDCFHMENLEIEFKKRFMENIQIQNKKYIFPVETKVINSESIMEYHDKYTNMGYEGVMIRHINAPYELNKRSKKLLKFKKFHTEEFQIIDVISALGKDKNTAIFVCNGFKARPIGTWETRHQYYVNRNRLIGKFVTVKYQETTSQGVPRFPIAIAIRDYE